MNFSFKRIFFNTFPIPSYLAMPYAGVDISPATISFIEIVKHGSELRVGKYDTLKLNELFDIDNPKEKQDEVKNILKKWKKDFGLKFVEVTLPEEKAYLYKTEIDLQSDKEMRQMIEFGLEENAPISLSDAVFDYRIVETLNNNTKASVMVTVLPDSVVEGYIDLFEECGLVPVSFLIEAQALSKAIIKRDSKKTYLVAHIGKTRTGVFVVSSGNVRFTSTLPIGGRDFTKALMKQYVNTFEESEEIKKTKGFENTEENKKSFEALLPTASALKDEIEKIYIYWKNHGDKNIEGKVDIEGIILCGKDSLMKGFVGYVEESMRVKTEIGNVWENITDFDDYIPPINRDEAMNFGSAIGVSLPRMNS